MTRARIPRCRPRRGVAVVYLAILCGILCGFVSLGVDWARVQLIKSQLYRSADAASRAAAGKLLADATTARNAATAIANGNSVDGGVKTGAFDANSDLDFGTWNSATRTFTVGTFATANAVRVKMGCTAARGNSVSLTFSRLLGQSTCDVNVLVVAATTGGGYGAVGLNFITMSGNSSDSYWSPSGYTSGARGAIASNGNITLSGSSYINGDARPGVGKSVNSPARVAGSTAPLTTPLSYPNGSAGSYATVNDNATCSCLTAAPDLNLGGSSSGTMSAGHYYVHDVNIANNATLTITGKVTIYVYHDFTLNGTINTYNGIPANLSIVMVGNSPLKIASNTSLYAQVYAPQSAITMSGNGDFYGSILGLSITMSGTSAIHYDLSLPGAAGTISTTK